MELIYLLLRELRYLIKPKKVKKYITIALIIFLLSTLYSRVFAVSDTITFEYNGVSYELPAPELDNYFIHYENNYFRIVSLPQDEFNKNNSYIGHYISNNIHFIKTGENNNDFYRYYFINGVWEQLSTYNGGTRHYMGIGGDIVYTSHDIVNNDGSVYMQASQPAEPVKIAPFVKNESGELESWNFQEFLLDSGDYTTLDDVYVKFYYSRDNSSWFNAETFHLNYESDYVVTDNPFGHYVAHIPITEIYKNFTLRQGNYIGFEVIYGEDIDYYGGYQLTVTSEQTTDNETAQTQTELEKQTQAIQQQTTAINQTTQAIENQTNTINDTNNFLKDETVDDSAFDLPTVEVNDPTTNFFDTMFTGLYNAFTNSDDISIDVELLGQNHTINSSNFNFLQDNRFAVLRLIMSSFWVYRIGIFILKDIRKILDKIKDGDVEHAVTSDIKADSV